MQTFAESRFNKGALAAPDRILVATDLNDGDYLVPHVVAQALASSAHVTLIHAILPADSFPVQAGLVQYVDRAKIDRDVRLMLLGIARQIETHGISCDVVSRHGFAAEVIREELKATGASRLIMGTHGRGRWGQFALGSVAHELLRNVDVPIFTVGPHAQHPTAHDLPRRILHPVSLAGDYKKSVDLAIDLAQANRAELTLLHVLDPDVEKSIDMDRVLAWAKNALNALAPGGADLVPPIYTSATSGRLVEQILQAAAETGADWIVLGVDGTYPLWSFQESTAYKVLTMATCPVLTIRHDTRQAVKDSIDALRFVDALG